jgi:glycosyltransferase involved in cell wall biosynthesis
MTMPLVSVVMIVRNGERFIALAINSIIEQEYRPIEIIVVDGQSTDRTADIAQSYPYVRYIRQVNNGVAEAYNIGIAAANGEFISFLSYDDLWVKDKLTTQVDYLLQHSEVQYTIGNVQFFLDEGSALPSGFKPHLLEGEHVGYIMETLLARKSVFGQVGKFDPAFHISNDTDWYARAKDLQIPVAVIPKVLLLKRVHDSNTTSNVDGVQRDILHVLRRSLSRKKSLHGATEENPESDATSKTQNPR